MKQITRYFRNAVLASSQGVIDYKKEHFETIMWEEVKAGKINNETLKAIWEKVGDKEDDEKGKVQSKNVIIALKTIATEFLDGGYTDNTIEELTSILFLPAKIDFNGFLYQPDDKYPWIPREFLEPMIEPQIAIGTSADYDDFWEETTDQRNQIDSWEKYLAYAIDMYNWITKSDFALDYIEEKKIKTDGKFYIFEDSTIDATFNILQLYNELLQNKENLLYSKMTNGKIETSKLLCGKLDCQKMKCHVGQMGGEYPLSPSQREAINCFQEIGEGEVLAVNGPPGTGKTTFLQSVVANMYVEAALRGEKAPVIVATSTNNQAVTNIIESFAKINSIGIKNLERRWITGVNSFSVYYPAIGKIKEAKEKGYQYTSVNGGGFVDEVETEENRESAETLFYSEYCEYFAENINSLEICKAKIHSELKKLDEQRVACIGKLEEVKNIIGAETCSEYISNLERKVQDVEQEINRLALQKEQAKQRGEELKNRQKEWRQSYDSLPWYIRLFKFLPCFKKKITAWSFDFMAYEELSFLNRSMSIEEIEEKYYQCIEDNDMVYRKIISDEMSVEEVRRKLKDEYDYYAKVLQEIEEILLKFSVYKVSVSEGDFIHRFDIEQVNNSLDKVRYAEFWLAVHYYEVLWLIEENPITDKQKGKTFENVLDNMYHRIAMLAPCMVMTCFKLPQQFWAYDNNDKKHYYMYDYIDLLIVDEAGQISPEIGMPAFALAKKAVVVGDECQIPPVWGNQRALDVAMAIGNKVISVKEEFGKLEENGLNCSQSSVMKIASLSCPFEKYGKGLFLSEHRRCYNEIIQYCNDLVYNGNLEPLRGYAEKNKNNALSGWLPPMGHKQIETLYSRRVSGSRENLEEAKAIVEWLKKNYDAIVYKYKKIEKDEEVDQSNIIGVITPFKRQSVVIRQLIKKQLPQISHNISVGTVHTFQGAERKIIIFSSVYGSEDGCYFIDANESLMNVAVSRAKDSFLVFGDRGCLKGNGKSASGLLKRATCQTIE